MSDNIPADTIRAVSFTGYRPDKLYGYKSEEPYTKLQQTILNYIDTYAPHADTFITGGAQGTDQLMFWGCREKYPQATHIVICPFPGQEDKWSEDGMFGKAAYRDMLDAASKVEYRTQTRPDNYKMVSTLMHARNDALVKSADLIIGIARHQAILGYNDKGGTASTIQRACRKNKPCIVIDPDTLEVMTM